jgi:hypothetical protein
VHFAAHRFVGEGRFEVGDEADRALDPSLDIGGEAPVGEAKLPARPVEPAVQDEKGLVAEVALQRQPAMTASDPVELVAAEHEERAAIRRPVHRLPTHEDVAELEIAEAPDILVVIAGNEGDSGARASLGENLPEHVAVELRPERSPGETPEVDDVADEVETVAIVSVQEIQEHLGLAVSRAQVNIGEPDRPVVGGGHEASLAPVALGARPRARRLA